MHSIVPTLVVCGVLCLASSIHSSRAGEQTALAVAAHQVARPEILIIAHRGDSKKAPENTLPAFSSALKAKADLVELDYYHSADGIPVVFHDGTLGRTTDATRFWGDVKTKITSKSLAELKMLDAGNWFDSKFHGTRIPTLLEALHTIQNGSMTLIERKGGDPATCVELLQENNLLDQVVVQAFDWDYLTGCHCLAPALILAALGDKTLTPEKLDQIDQTGAKVVAWEDKNTDASTIAAIHARNLKAWVWTVDRPERIRELVAAKIDGIITNRPSETRAVVQAAQAGH